MGAVLKMLVAHPRTISIFPQFAQENIANLEKNPEFIAVGKALMAAFEFMVSNIGEPQVLRRVLANRPFEKYFVDYVSSLNSLRILPVTSLKLWMKNWVHVSLPLLATSGNVPSTLPIPSWLNHSNKQMGIFYILHVYLANVLH